MRNDKSPPQDRYSPFKKWVVGIYFWTMFVIITPILYLGVLWVVARDKLFHNENYGRSVHEIASLWAKSILALTPGWKVVVSGTEHLPQNQPMVIVANHESMADIWALYSLGIQFRWLSKAEVFRVPLIGSTMGWARYVPIRRGDKESHEKALEQSKEALKAGVSMFFFPEGTRSRTGDIQSFKIGAFKVARDSQVPILPIAIHGSGKLMPKGSGLPGKALVQITILPPYVPAADLDLDDVAARVRQRVVDAHQHLRTQAARTSQPTSARV